MNTAQDIVYFLISSAGGGAQDGEHASVRQAVIHGVREVLQCRQWLWHTRSGSFTTNQIRATASFTQGSKDMVVSDPTGFVPGRVVEVGASHFPTPTRITSVSGNVVTVDVAAGQSGSGVTVMPQTYYDLPRDVKDIDALVTNTVGTLHCYITPQEWQRLEINTRGAGEPYYYTIMRSDSDPDRYQIRFVGVPVENTVVHYTYRTIPKPVKYMGYERICRQGSVALAPAGENNIPTVTGTGTAFPQDCPGAYIRFGAAGMEADPSGSTFPFIAERRIESWTSQTQLIVSDETIYERPHPSGVVNFDEYDGGVVGGVTPPSPPTGSTNLYTSSLLTLPANTKYAITDVIDASPQMWTAILSACEMWYARIAGKPYNDAMVVFNRDLRLAMENDTISPFSGRPKSGMYPTPRSAGWHSRLLPDLT